MLPSLSTIVPNVSDTSGSALAVIPAQSVRHAISNFTLWLSANASGRITQNWPFTLVEFWQQTREPDPDDYLFG